MRMLWSSLQVTPDGETWAGQVPANLAGGPITGGILFAYVNGAYQSATTLISGEGYWVHNSSGQTLYLLFDGANVFKAGQGPAPSFSSLAAGTIQPPPPPDAGLAEEDSGSGCGSSGLEAFVLLGLAFRSRLRRRTLTR